MKKLVALTAAFAVFACHSFAEIKTSMWAQMGMNMWNHSSAGSKDAANDDTVGMYPTFAPLGRVGVSFTGIDPDEKMGFAFDVNYQGFNSLNQGKYYAGNPYTPSYLTGKGYTEGYYNAPVCVGDNAYVWGKVLPGLTLKVGHIAEDTLRTTKTFESQNNISGFRLINDMFKKFEILAGIHALYQYDNLILAAGVDTWDGSANETATWFGTPYTSAESVYKGTQIAAGYKLPQIGMIKAQYKFAERDSNNVDQDWLNLGFRLDAVENLEAELTTTIYPDWAYHNGGTEIAGGAKYTWRDGRNEKANVYAGAKWFNGNSTAVSQERKNNTYTNVDMGLNAMYFIGRTGVGITNELLVKESATGTAKTYTVTPTVRQKLARYFGYFEYGIQYEYYDSGISGDDTVHRFRLPVGLQFAM